MERRWILYVVIWLVVAGLVVPAVPAPTRNQVVVTFKDDVSTLDPAIGYDCELIPLSWRE